MKLLKNLEVKQYGLILLLVTVFATIAGAFVGAACAICVFAACVAVGLISMVFVKRRYNRLARLSDRIELLLHGEEGVDFSSFQEGEIAILSNMIDKMAIRLREQAGALACDKQYLKDSLADISHQLRTPLTTLRIISARLREEDLDADERLRLVAKVDGTLSRLEWLIDTLLKISQLESGTVAFEQRPVSVPDLIHRCVEPFEIMAELREITLAVHLEGEIGFTGDARWTAQALENIIRNCIEHTPAGGAVNIAAAENPIYTEIIVSDTGSGISPKDLPHVFERFYQGERHASNHYGIGLALAQMIIHGQNGTIQAENNKDGGARFGIRFYKIAM